MANAKISNNSVFVPKFDITEIDGLAGYTGSGNVKITGTDLKTSVLTGAITSITASAPLSRTSGNTPTISISQASASSNGYLSSSDWTTFNSKGSGTVTGVTGTAPVSVTSGNTPVVSMSAANGSTNGYLTSTDWTTFNSKSNFSGAYADLTGKPTIPTSNSQLTNGAGYITSSSVGDGTLTITVDGSSSTFTANQSGDTNISFTTGSGSSIAVSDEGTQLTSDVTSFNFTGSGVTATATGDAVTVNVAGGGGSGDITGVTATSPLTGGGTSGDVTVGIQEANTGQSGFLSSTDWNTFNSKTNNAGTVTQIIASSPLTGGTITGSGTIGIPQASTSASGYLTSTDWNTFNNKGSGTLTSVSATAPLAVTNGSGPDPAFSIVEANASTNGFISATDWNTFNDKQDLLVSATNIKTINGNNLLGSGDLVVSGSANNNTITLVAGTGLTGGDSFTLNQSSDKTITFNNSITNNNQLTNGRNFITASSADTLTNKSGSNSQWTNDENYITSASLPTVNDGTLTITVNGSATTFTANQSGDSSVSITTGSGSGTVTEVTANTPLSVTSGTSTPDLSIAQANTSTSGFLSSTDWNTFNNKSNFSGAYADLTGKPTIPTATSQLTNDSGFITASSTNTLTNKSGNITQWTQNWDEVDILGDGSNAGKLKIYCENTTTPHYVEIEGPSHSGASSYTIKLPSGAPASNQILQAASGGQLSWVDNDGNDNFYVTGASYSAGTLTLTRNGGLADVTATGFLQIGTSSTTALAGDTTTITTAQANEITANTAKVGITTAQANEITANTAKVGITTAQANEITANTAKVGITTAQASDITANNAKVTFPGFGTTAGTALEGDTVIPAAANNPLITLVAGTNLTGGGTFNLDQPGAQTITFDASGGSGGGFPSSVTASSTAATSAAVDTFYTITTTSGVADIVVTLPTAASNSGKIIGVKYAAQNSVDDTVVIKTISSQTIDGTNRTTNGLPLASIGTYYEVISDGSNWWIK